MLRTYRWPSLDVWLDVSKYVLFKWCRHSASTYVHMIPRVRLREPMYSEFHIAKKSWKKDSQIYRKSLKNRPLGPPWDACGATWAPLGKHFGHLFPKDWILETWRKVLGVQKGQLGSNLEAQDPPKRNPKREKLMLRNNIFLTSIFSGFGIDFGRSWASKLEPSWVFLPKKMIRGALLSHIKLDVF